jgi:heme A synthase
LAAALQPRSHAVLTATATLALMVMGSLVHGTGSSLACPDWPLCHGSFFPAMTGGVEFEHTHRLMAAAVVVLLVTLAWRLRRHDGGTRGLALAACALVAVQATLGGLTVLYRLPPAISIAHLATSMTLLAVLAVVATRLSESPPAPPAGAIRKYVGGVAALALAQVVAGAVVRHSGAALACTGLPLCDGRAWPASWQGEVHMLHRAGGVAVLAAAIAVSVAAHRRQRTRGGRAIALAPALVAMAQVALGATVVLAWAPLDLVTLHHAGGAVLLASLAALWAHAGPRAMRRADAERGDPAVAVRTSIRTP